MYDLVKKTRVNEKVILVCVSDKNETALIKHYLKIIGENNSGNRRIADILELSITPFIPVQINLLLIPERNLSALFGNCSFAIHDGIQRVITPPPEFC
jgi:hypothetical protein